MTKARKYTNWLTKQMKHSPSREANSWSASQEILRLLKHTQPTSVLVLSRRLNSMKFSAASSRVNILKCSDVSGTNSLPHLQDEDGEGS